MTELRRLGVRPVAFAPRFVGTFEKGVDYLGDPDALEADIATHAAIARHLGPYRVSIHSGSDKFSIYDGIERATRGMFHLKTSGTSYLQALRTVAATEPALFRSVWHTAVNAYVSAGLSIADRRRLEAAVRLVPLLLTGRPRVLVHGDLAPVNMLVRDGRLSGLLDVEAVRLADPLFDAAWFDWLMRFHHPAQRDEAWLGLSESGGLDLDEPNSAALRHVLPTLRILEGLADAAGHVDQRPQRFTQLRASLDLLPV